MLNPDQMTIRRGTVAEAEAIGGHENQRVDGHCSRNETAMDGPQCGGDVESPSLRVSSTGDLARGFGGCFPFQIVVKCLAS
jgi:hypothetical protein